MHPNRRATAGRGYTREPPQVPAESSGRQSGLAGGVLRCERSTGRRVRRKVHRTEHREEAGVVPDGIEELMLVQAPQRLVTVHAVRLEQTESLLLLAEEGKAGSGHHRGEVLASRSA